MCSDCSVLHIISKLSTFVIYFSLLGNLSFSPFASHTSCSWSELQDLVLTLSYKDSLRTKTRCWSSGDSLQTGFLGNKVLKTLSLSHSLLCSLCLLSPPFSHCHSFLSSSCFPRVSLLLPLFFMDAWMNLKPQGGKQLDRGTARQRKETAKLH